MGPLEPQPDARPAPRGRGTPRRRAPLRRAAALVAAALLLAAPLPDRAGAAPADDPSAQSAAAIGPVNYAVVVDESGSISKDDLAREKSAALRIALGELSAASTVTVLGFASADDPSQHVVDEVCPPTSLDAASRDKLSGCVDKLAARTRDQGWDTDFPTALEQARSLLVTGTDPATPRVVFLLTDGKLDVPDSPQWGDPDHRNGNAQTALTQTLAKAAADKVQVWPLGFGNDVDKAELDLMASSGYQNGCTDLPDSRPRATEVPDSGTVATALQTAFAAAHCLRSSVQQGRPPIDIPVRISPLATVGSIVVDKGDPAVTVRYFDPDNREVTGTGEADNSKFEYTTGPTEEALRITDPRPGLWRVHLDAPEGHRSQLATVSVLWHGELRSSIVLDPPSPRPGQRMTVSLRLQTRQDVPLTDDLQDVQDLAVSARLTGDGFAPVPLRLADDGAPPDAAAKDGTFTGTVTVPDTATGRLKVAATLTASGLTADQDRSEGSWIAPAQLLVTAALAPPPTSARTSDHLTATLALHNGDTVPHVLGVRIDDGGGLLTPTPATVTVPPGGSPTVRLDLAVAPRAAFGRQLGRGSAELGGKVVVFDTTDQGRVLTERALSVRVVPRPGWLAQYQWWLVTGAVLLAVLVLLLLSLRRLGRGRRDAAGLQLRLIGEDGRLLTSQTAKSGPNGWFEFDVVDPRGPHPRIQRRTGGAYKVQRDVDGGAVLETRVGRGRSKVRDDAPVPLGNGLLLGLGAEAARTTRRGPRPAPAPEPETNPYL
ncbi:VWA domain-containing protein [Kitasatospora sp. NPDC058965]|uniref:VWA domain-containing protein n=1 Tax=Kitasatospora sp. NPDC058965 TaxID=3346682 RepID=UPI0036B7782D